MKATTWKSLSLHMLYVLIFLTLSGALSYFTADGTAVIGPNPDSVEAQRADIALSVFWACLIAGSVCLFSFIMSKRAAGQFAPGKYPCEPAA